MKAVVLAAGKSSRFYPFTTLPHKSFVKLAGKTLLEHTLLSIKETGITDIILVIGKDCPVDEVLKSKDLENLNIKLVIQPEPLGMGDALSRARNLIDEDFFLINPMHFDFPDYKELLANQKNESDELVLLAAEEENPEKYGVLRIEGDRCVEVVEKPKKEEAPSHLRVIGIYLLTKLFLETLDHLPSEHYSLEKAISLYAQNHYVRFVETKKKTPTLKHAWDMLALNQLLLQHHTGNISSKANIAQNAVVGENVVIEEGAVIMEGACIKNHCYIGKNAIIGNNAVIRDSVSIGENSVVGALTEIKNTILLDDVKIHSGFLGDSVVGSHSRIGALFCSANRRLDRKEIKTSINQNRVNTGLTSLGIITGENVKIGIHVATMPGVIIGNNSLIGPLTVVMNNVADNTTYYSKQEIIEKEHEK